MSNGGVRSLLARFENQNQEASPDVRGRSPAGSLRSDGDTTSRPLSKIRTSFVAVEPMKQTRKDTPEHSVDTPHERRGSFSMDRNRPSDQEAINEMQKTMSQELELRKSNSEVRELIPENAIESAPPTPLPTAHKPTIAPSTTNNTTADARKPLPASSNSLDNTPPSKSNTQKSGYSPSPRVMRNLAENLRTPKPAAQENDLASYFPPITPSSALKQESSKATLQKEQKPTSASIETSASKAESATTTTQEAPAKVTVERSPRNKSRLSGGTVTTGGFIKPKPRSPTRPVKLPAHLVAPTQSSAAKRGETPAPVPPRTISRRSSTISNASYRTSIRPTHAPARPKKTPASPPSQPPRSPQAPPSFLERMMRPTASSASKVKDPIKGVISSIKK